MAKNNLKVRFTIDQKFRKDFDALAEKIQNLLLSQKNHLKKKLRIFIR